MIRFNNAKFIRKQIHIRIRIIIIKTTGKIKPKIQYTENVYWYAYLLYKLFKSYLNTVIFHHANIIMTVWGCDVSKSSMKSRMKNQERRKQMLNEKEKLVLVVKLVCMYVAHVEWPYTILLCCAFVCVHIESKLTSVIANGKY